MNNTILHEIIKGESDTFTLSEDEFAYKNGQYYRVYISERVYCYGMFLGRWRIFSDKKNTGIYGNQPPLCTPSDGFEIITTDQIMKMRKKVEQFDDFIHFGVSLT